MLKPYLERKSGVQIVNTIDNIIHYEIEDTYTNELFNLSESTKLHNSDVLCNMNEKLSHLDELQRRDIEALIDKYQHLLPDVPSRTDRITHDVDIGNPPPIKQHPYLLNPIKQQHLDEEIN